MQGFTSDFQSYVLLYQHSWYILLADMMHFQLHNDDDVTTANENYYFLSAAVSTI